MSELGRLRAGSKVAISEGVMDLKGGGGGGGAACRNVAPL